MCTVRHACTTRHAHAVPWANSRASCIPCAPSTAQETSGIFLNYFLLMRHRTPDHWSVKGAFVLFVLCFFVYRITLGTYGTYHYVRHYRNHLPAQVTPSPSLPHPPRSSPLPLTSSFPPRPPRPTPPPIYPPAPFQTQALACRRFLCRSPTGKRT